MSLPLTQATLRAAYDYLGTTPPFNKWNLPDGEEVHFIVSRDATRMYGFYRCNGKDNGHEHEIGISSQYVAHTNTLIPVMAHEMLHLHQQQTGMHRNHGRAFRMLWRSIAEVHGFDPLASF